MAADLPRDKSCKRAPRLDLNARRWSYRARPREGRWGFIEGAGPAPDRAGGRRPGQPLRRHDAQRRDRPRHDRRRSGGAARLAHTSTDTALGLALDGRGLLLVSEATNTTAVDLAPGPSPKPTFPYLTTPVGPIGLSAPADLVVTPATSSSWTRTGSSRWRWRPAGRSRRSRASG